MLAEDRNGILGGGGEHAKEKLGKVQWEDEDI